MFPLPFRQVHLDFHTSEALHDIGAAFDPGSFAATLAAAHVNSVTLFARCHHGWLYYDSKRFPELVHPNLSYKHLLRDQMDACRDLGIRTPVYITVQFDHLVSRQHPEWLVMDREGKTSGPGPFAASFYQFLAVNTGYGDYVRETVQDVFESVPNVDSLFFDIMMPHICSNPVTIVQMQEAGLDPTDREARRAFGVEVINRFKTVMSAHVRSFNPDCGIVYNAGHVGPRHRAVKDTYSHFEIESLGSGQWGYAHFPSVARYVRTLGKPFLGMTGKFHTEWGDFHSFKPAAALEFEISRILAAGGACSIGDQLPPSGILCEETYRLIGSVYAEVEKKEPWCAGAKAVCDVAVLSLESAGFHQPAQHDEELPELVLDGSHAACTRMLEECGVQFDIIDTTADFSNYALVVLPDRIEFTEDRVAKLKRYLEQGGSLLATYASGLNADKTAFTAGFWPVAKTGDGPLDDQGQPANGRIYEDNAFAEYMLPNDVIGKSLPPVEHVMYARGLDVAPVEGAEVLAETRCSFFDRRWTHLCSHRQAPSSGVPGAPAVVRKGRVIYFRHPLFWIYHHTSPVWVKEIFRDAVRELLPYPVTEHTGPGSLGVALNHQAAEHRHVLHLLHYVAVKKAAKMEIVEDRYSSGPFELVVRLPSKITSIRTVPEEKDVEEWTQSFEEESGRWRIGISSNGVEGHRMMELLSSEKLNEGGR